MSLAKCQGIFSSDLTLVMHNAVQIAYATPKTNEMNVRYPNPRSEKVYTNREENGHSPIGPSPSEQVDVKKLVSKDVYSIEPPNMCLRA